MNILGIPVQMSSVKIPTRHEHNFYFQASSGREGCVEKQRELARKGSLKNGNLGSPVNQQPKKNNVMARTRLVVPNKGYSSLDQSPDEKPLVALDTDSDDDFDMSRYSSSGYSSAEQINQDLNIQLLKDGYRLDEIPDDEDLDLIPPKSVNPTCMCCQATSSTACHIQ
ncbi:protein FAM219A isoform X4 [Emydura macquarii macquarii]|uniref:protein FAM219A isoform X4 n=1 Tax=Emydura macquarii macquarii TaxID=1129001 RepID=UPI00352A2D51